MPGISLQPGIIYGPVLSRRLGRSLGINLLPVDHKVCSFNCVYCQYGRTVSHTLTPEPEDLPGIADILAAVEKALKKPRTIDFLTFSGNGEPSLHPQFSDIVRGVQKLRYELRPEAKLAILSNSSRVTDPDIIDALSLIDAPMMKLDAGDETTFKAMHQPVGGLHLDDLLTGLRSVRNLMIQSVLIDGEITNSRGSAYECWAERLSELHPCKVHIYSSERPTASSGVICLSPNRLKSIAEDLHARFDLPVEAFYRD